MTYRLRTKKEKKREFFVEAKNLHGTWYVVESFGAVHLAKRRMAEHGEKYPKVPMRVIECDPIRIIAATA